MRLFKKMFLIVIFCAFNSNAQSPVSNERALEALFFRGLDSLKFEQFFSDKPLRIKFEGPNDEQRAFCKSRLIKYFNQKQIAVDETKKAVTLVVLEFKPQIRYLESVRQFLGFGKTIRREIELSFKAYVEKGPAVQNNAYREINLTSSDSINRRTVNGLEESPFTFTRGQWVSYSRWTRYLQPAIIVGSVSALIYLFYSLRT